MFDPTPPPIRFADLTERELDALDRTVTAADLVNDVIGPLRADSRQQLVTELVRHIPDITGRERSRLVRYFNAQ